MKALLVYGVNRFDISQNDSHALLHTDLNKQDFLHRTDFLLFITKNYTFGKPTTPSKRGFLCV